MCERKEASGSVCTSGANAEPSGEVCVRAEQIGKPVRERASGASVVKERWLTACPVLSFFTLVNSSSSFTSSVEPPFSTVLAVLLLFISLVMSNTGRTSPIRSATSPAASMAVASSVGAAGSAGRTGCSRVNVVWSSFIMMTEPIPHLVSYIPGFLFVAVAVLRSVCEKW